MKTLTSQGRNLGLVTRLLLGLALLCGMSLTAAAQDFRTLNDFPGLNGPSGGTRYDMDRNNSGRRPATGTFPEFDSGIGTRPSIREPDDWGDPSRRYLNPVGQPRPIRNTPGRDRLPSLPTNHNASPVMSYEEWLRTQPEFFNAIDRPLPSQNDFPRFDDLLPGGNGGQPSPRPVPLDPAIEELQKDQQAVSFRYRNPVLMRFLQSLSSQQAVSLYREINDLVDRRHLEPTSYRQRVEKGVANLGLALNNSDFREVNRVRLSSQQVATFQSNLTQTLNPASVQSREQAVAAMQRAMSLGQQAGLSPQVVAIEFIFGTTDTLDKYSAFVPDDVRSQPSAAAVEDSVVGIGIEVKMVEDGLRIERVLNNGPAHEAGLQAGDIVVNVDGKSVVGANLDAAVDLIGGRSGSRITLGLVRGSGAPFAVSMIRRRVEIQTVNDVRMLDESRKVGYLRLDKFAEKSSSEMDAALWSLHQKGMQSLVLDLRGNPGGLLTSAVEISNKFLVQGTIVSTKGRLAEDNMSEAATRPQTWKVPLVVLVDENSASASEIFAAAIQENGRGVIVGRKSYGKGTVQTHFPLRSVSGALRITTAMFYSPAGRKMAGAGVTPDLAVNHFTLESRTLENGDLDIRAALRVAGTSELADMAARSAQPGGNVPGDSFSNR